MTLPHDLAALHALAFHGPACWSEAAFASAVENERCFLAVEAGRDCLKIAGFSLGRSVADEAELLTLVVHPDRRRTGLGRDLLGRFEAGARERCARAAFLEVSADNTAGRLLYESAGWIMAGQRSGYYEGVDAITMRKDL